MKTKHTRETIEMLHPMIACQRSKAHCTQDAPIIDYDETISISNTKVTVMQ